MDYIILAGIAVLAVLHIITLLRMRKTDGSDLTRAFREMQDSEQKLRSEQNAHISETVKLSVQMVNENLSQGQKQMRESTESGLNRIAERVADQVDTNERQLSEIREQVSRAMQRQAAQSGEAMQQAREMTAAQLGMLEKRVQGLEAAQSRAMEQLRQAVDHQLDTLREQNDARLADMQKSVNEKLEAQLSAKMDESFRRVTASLEAVYQGLGEMKQLASDVGGLKRVLSNVKQRGTLGELQLGNILREILAPEQYLENAETVPGSNKRVEFAVRLPREDGSSVLLPIDSKFPADCYTQLLDAQESGNAEAIKAARTALSQRLQAFAKDIREKYIHEPETTAFGIMFLPFEGLYAEAISLGMVETLQQKCSVNIAGPSTMAALLNAVSMGFRSLAIQQQSARVWEILNGVLSEFEKFEDGLNQTKKKLDAAGKELDQLVGMRTRAITKQLRDVQKLEVK